MNDRIKKIIYAAVGVVVTIIVLASLGSIGEDLKNEQIVVCQ